MEVQYIVSTGMNFQLKVKCTGYDLYWLSVVKMNKTRYACDYQISLRLPDEKDPFPRLTEGRSP